MGLLEERIVIHHLLFDHHSIAYALHRTKLHTSITLSYKYPSSVMSLLEERITIHHLLFDHHHDFRLVQPRTPID